MIRAGSLVDYESQKIKRTVLSTNRGRILFVMDLSSEIADFHTTTYANNLVTTARTIHLHEPQETIHMMSMLRKEACSESIHDLAYIPIQNCLADCLTKASAKAENLITAVKTGRLLDVDIHPNFRTIMEHKTFLSTWCRTFMHTREKNVFFLDALKISLSLTSFKRRTIPCDVCESFRGLGESRRYENNVCTCRRTHLSIHRDDDIVHVHTRHNHFSQCLTFLLSQCCDHVDIKARPCLRDKQFLPRTNS